MSSFEEILDRDGKLIYKTKGTSMRPMLRENRDLVVIAVPDRPVKKYDVVLYKRNNAYVLHRVLRVNESEYLIRGDNTYSMEKVPRAAVLGILTEFKRNGKTYSVNNTGYRYYARIWHAIYPLRRLAIRVRKKLGYIARAAGLSGKKKEKS